MMKTLSLLKRYCLLLAVLMLSAMPSQAGYLWECPIEWNGDVNRDGEVNIADVADLVDALLENDLSSVEGDVNVDGEVNIADVVDLVDMLLYEPDDVEPLPIDPIVYNMIYVRSDTYMMGATIEQEPYASDNERAVHQVRQYPFYIGQTEVTQELWQAVMGGNPSFFKGKDLPVQNVSWNDCQEFIMRLNRFTGKRYRLPTEAEWELAARGGRNRHNYVYAGSNTLADVGWFDSNSGEQPRAVATLDPNELKIYDMSGNVWEWCQDFWAPSYDAEPALNPLGPVTGTARVLRGGSWLNLAANCRVSSRYSYVPTSGSYTTGFRLAMDAPYASWFMLADKIVYLKVGEQRNVAILNGNGSYTVYNGNTQIVRSHTSGEQLVLQGLKVGTTSVIVKDNLTGDQANVTVIVYKSVPKRPGHVDGVDFDMIYVEGGITKLGATTEQGSDAYSNESPAHNLSLSNYYIGETEVTQALWKAVMGSNPSNFTGDLQLPVERVSWVDCMEFLDRLNAMTGEDYRLPTEAEWEYAARGGIFSQGFKYAGGNDIGAVAWYSSNSGGKTHAVASKLPNELGVYDMTGNVFEWCQDYLGNYATGFQLNPTGPETGTSRVNRGGAYSSSARMSRVSYRRGNVPTTVNSTIGLRLALDAPGTHRFGLSRHLVRMEVGEHRTLDIFNGSGDYTLTNNGPTIVESSVDGDLLLLTGLSAGTTGVIVTDNVTGAKALVTVIVTQRHQPAVIPVLNDTIWMEFVKGGTFEMGCTPEQQPVTGDDNEIVHQVTLSSYYICNSEVTQHLWYAVMGSNPAYFSPSAGRGDDLYKPVESVSWYDCQRFIARLNMMTGLNFRMPTEAEWEYAARGGTHSGGYRYAGSNTCGDVAWYNSNSNQTTHHCRLKAPNELNLYDMSGNVGEWCLDWFDSYASNPQYNPVGPYSGSKRVWRGGCWASTYTDCQVSIRVRRSPSERQDFLGLRLAMDAEEVNNPDDPSGPDGGGDVIPRFRLAKTVVTLEVGEQVDISILHGSGNYTVMNSEQYVLADVDGETLTLTGKAVGYEDVIVKDNEKNAYALVTVIVVEPTSPSNVVLDDSVTFDMIYIPAGAFIMGNDAVPGAAPAHYVSVDDYFIGSTEVTNLMWRWVMDYPINWKATDLYKPIEGLSWDDCQEFIERLNEKTGRQYRLPTEAEWEYAAMGANRGHGYSYAGSNAVGDVAWYWNNLPSQQIGTSGYGVQRVAGKRANEKGIFDMSGNVREWCQDWFGAYPMGIQVSPMGPENGTDRVLRGGCYLDSSDPCRVKARSASRQSGANYVGTGFRLAMDAVIDTLPSGPTPDHHVRLSLSKRIIRIPVGEQRSVNIYNGSGSYTLYNSNPAIAGCLVDGETLSLTGLTVGTTDVKVVDNITLSAAWLTVIVYKPGSGGVVPGPDELFNEPNMIFVHGGTFVRGATSEQGSSQTDELPIHQVTVSNYYISQTEVTQRLWERVMGGNPSHFKGEKLPVEQVSWEDCQEFIRRLNQMTGRQYRMVTEAEWEYAARGGRLSMGYKYAGANTVSNMGWYKGNSGSTSHEVAKKLPNELGIYDMSGNVWEWCQDVYGAYGSDSQFNPVGPDPEFSGGAVARVMRGGGWDGALSDCRVARRLNGAQDYMATNVGLRLAMDAPSGPPLSVDPHVLELNVGESATVTILNGTGDYTATGGSSIASFQLSGSSLTVTGQQVGTTTINIKDNLTMARTVVTVIVRQPREPHVYKTITFWIRYISGGAFDQGATSEQGSNAPADELPVHRTMVPSFGIGETEVTQELWQAIMGYNPSVNTGDLQQPVDNVTWEEAEQFVARLSDLLDKPYRLPTEAEWEYAARGGRYGSPYRYAGSNTIGKVAWYGLNSGGTTHAVGTKASNSEYLYDMSGNVDEWCHDWYGPYGAEPLFDPEGPDTADYHVARGGRWDSPATDCRVSARSAGGFGETLPGVRIALERPYSYWFWLSRSIVWLKVGGNRTVDIHNGSGSYTIYSSKPGIASYVVEGDQILLTGLKQGRTVLQVMDNVSHEHKTLTVIVRNPTTPWPDDPDDPEPYIDPEPSLNNLLRMVYVRGGTFAMGATTEQGTDAADDESPSHLVTLSNYYVSETEVTQALWKRVMGGNPSHFKGDNLPVEQVSWEECQEFISRLNNLTGRQYRLLTEAEWEYAARGGNKSKHYKYAGSSTVANVAWYSGNSSNATHAVKLKTKNELGIYDMSGNVAEWCQDCYGVYSADNQRNPVGADPDGAVANRVVRGGAWEGAAVACRVSSRASMLQDYSDSHIGLRLARDADDSGTDGLMVVTHRVVELEVGEQATVGIVNGSGNYVAAGGGGIVRYSLSGSTLTLTGLQAGTTTVNVKDNTSGVWTIITVIVTEGEIPYIYRNVKFWIKYINGGAFNMGATDEQGSSAAANESPVHRAMLPAYGIGKTEVTQELWQAVMGYNNSVNKGNLQLPVDNITWDEAQEFVSRLSDIFDLPFRLPTEAEWEYAARGARGTKGYKYAGGNSASTVAWYSGNSSGTTHPVGTKKANERQLYDMSGNVDEWCQDWYGPYSEETVFDPVGPLTGSQHVVRGGRWTSSATDCRLSARSAGGFGTTLPGLRVALEYPYSYYFTLSRQTLWMEMGDNRSVNIYNGSGSYTISSNVSGVVSYVVNDDKLSLTGLQPGHTIITVLDNVAQEAKTISVTVVEPAGTNEPEDVDGADFEMIYVRGGTFKMGGTTEQGTDAYPKETPVHNVTLYDFKISNIEVTQELWQNVMGSNPSTLTGNLQYPVNNVSWNDCQMFIAKLNEKTGKHYRLPSEAEWEYAARGGARSLGYKYAGSNTIGNVAWYSGNASSKVHVVGTTSMANELGIYDMSGNVMEWCQDWYGSYTDESQVNPAGAVVGTQHVIRGGSWKSVARSCRVSHRMAYAPTAATNEYGLRLVEDVDHPLRFGLSSTMLTMEPGTQQTVNILNGSGDYTLDSGSSVVTCVLSGETITVTANLVGATTVSVTDNATGENVILTIIVTQPVAPFGLAQNELTMEVGQTMAIDILNGRGNYTVRASTSGIVTPTISGEALTVKALKVGTTTLTVTDVLTGSTATLAVTVTAPALPLQLSQDNLTMVVGMSATVGIINGKGSYSVTGGTGIVTTVISGNTLTLQALATGTATITVTDNITGLSAGLTVTVTQAQRGDVNCDGVIDENDYGELFAISRGKTPMSTYTADVNGDGTINFEYDMSGDNEALIEILYSGLMKSWNGYPFNDISTNGPKYDVNGDGEINIADFTAIIDCAQNGTTPYYNDDLDGDGSLNWRDVCIFHVAFMRLMNLWPDDPDEEEFTVNGVTFKMITVDGGTFMMGASYDDPDAYDTELPAHQVTLSTYKIGQTEVTQKLWKAVMGSYFETEWGYTNEDQDPVAFIPWDECQEFICRLNSLTGKNFRLPTEAEWEFAARGGNMSHGYSYSGSDNIDEVAWYDGNIVSYSKPMSVATKVPNELGLYDMSGNVNEWCLDWYSSYTDAARENPIMHSGTDHIFRGGDWFSNSRLCRVSFRDNFNIVFYEKDWCVCGFRLALDSDDSPNFRFSESVVTVEVGESKTVDILNKTGNVSIVRSYGSVYSYTINGNSLTITGKSPGKREFIIRDGYSGARLAVIYVIVTEAAVEEHEYVDLGLPSGTLWATCNIGASSPEEYGDYFAWGETEPKEVYDWTTYKWVSGYDYIKYNSNRNMGLLDWKTELDIEDDAAYVNWGAQWRMPTTEQMRELINLCTWTWTKHNGVDGCKFIGPNGNTLFLPAASYKVDNSVINEDVGSYGHYWSRTIDVHDCNVAYYLGICSQVLYWNDGYNRWEGLTIRPVRFTEEPAGSTEDFTVNGATFTMVTIPGGTCMMGEYADEAAAEYQGVILSTYKIGQTEVTQELWQAVMGNNPSYRTGDLQRPVENVSWNDCQEFILKLNQLTGKQFYLPTEAEWEFAARGGNYNQGYTYAGSNTISEVAWYENTAPRQDNTYVTQPVATKNPNELGLYDMSGNVNEWCQDWKGDFGHYTGLLDPTGPKTGIYRVIRGGSCGDYAINCCVDNRQEYSPRNCYPYLGLRLALALDNSAKFRLAETVVTVEVGESKIVDILYGNGSYSVEGSTTNFTSSIVSGKLKVTGAAVGTNTVTVTNTSSGATAALTVIVTDASQIQDHEYVDLGLPSGTLWATCNVGANSPEDYGDYFAWGETEPKTTYDWATYKWCNGSQTTMTKYCTNSSYGTVDNETELDPEDDAAYVNWGESWRMPTAAQQQELVEKCTTVLTTRNGVNGQLVTGPNGNSIFLPAAGYSWNGSLSPAGSRGGYWSRALSMDGSYLAYSLYFDSDNLRWVNSYRNCGFTVRAVRVSEVPAEVTDMPVITYDWDEDMYIISATGNGVVSLYMNGELVANPYVIERGNQDQTVTVTATAQEEGKLISETAIMEILIPAKEPSNLTTGEWAYLSDGVSPAMVGQMTEDHLFARNEYIDTNGNSNVVDNDVSFKESSTQLVWLWLDDDQIYLNETVQALTPIAYNTTGNLYNENTYSSCQFDIYVPISVSILKTETEEIAMWGDRLPSRSSIAWSKQNGTKIIDGIQYERYSFMIYNLDSYGAHFSGKDASMYKQRGALKKDDAPLLGFTLKCNSSSDELPDMIIANQFLILRETNLAGWNENQSLFYYGTGGNNVTQRFQKYVRVKLHY